LKNEKILKITLDDCAGFVHNGITPTRRGAEKLQRLKPLENG
jgi:hypothetical protein